MIDGVRSWILRDFMIDIVVSLYWLRKKGKEHSPPDALLLSSLDCPHILSSAPSFQNLKKIKIPALYTLAKMHQRNGQPQLKILLRASSVTLLAL